MSRPAVTCGCDGKHLVVRDCRDVACSARAAFVVPAYGAVCRRHVGQALDRTLASRRPATGQSQRRVEVTAHAGWDYMPCPWKATT